MVFDDLASFLDPHLSDEQPVGATSGRRDHRAK